MNKRDILFEKVKILNKAWKMIEKGIELIKAIFPKDKTLKHMLNILSKDNEKLQKYLLKKLEKISFDEQWEKIVKQLRKK